MSEHQTGAIALPQAISDRAAIIISHYQAA